MNVRHQHGRTGIAAGRVGSKNRYEVEPGALLKNHPAIPLLSLEQIDTPLISQPQLAAFFGVWAVTIAARIKRGELPQPTVCIGRQRYWQRDNLVGWLRAKSIISE